MQNGVGKVICGIGYVPISDELAYDKTTGDRITEMSDDCYTLCRLVENPLKDFEVNRIFNADPAVRCTKRELDSFELIGADLVSCYDDRKVVGKITDSFFNEEGLVITADVTDEDVRKTLDEGKTPQLNMRFSVELNENKVVRKNFRFFRLAY
jgi:hypothetical protein